MQPKRKSKRSPERTPPRPDLLAGLLGDIMQAQEVKSDELKAKQARLLEALRRRR
jgi:hypothetical protein